MVGPGVSWAGRPRPCKPAEGPSGPSVREAQGVTTKLLPWATAPRGQEPRSLQKSPPTLGVLSPSQGSPFSRGRGPGARTEGTLASHTQPELRHLKQAPRGFPWGRNLGGLRGAAWPGEGPRRRRAESTPGGVSPGRAQLSGDTQEVRRAGGPPLFSFALSSLGATAAGRQHTAPRDDSAAARAVRRPGRGPEGDRRGRRPGLPLTRALDAEQPQGPQSPRQHLKINQQRVEIKNAS